MFPSNRYVCFVCYVSSFFKVVILTVVLCYSTGRYWSSEGGQGWNGLAPIKCGPVIQYVPHGTTPLTVPKLAPSALSDHTVVGDQLLLVQGDLMRHSLDPLAAPHVLQGHIPPAPGPLAAPSVRQVPPLPQ